MAGSCLGLDGDEMIAEMADELNAEFGATRVIVPRGASDNDRGLPEHFAGHEPNPDYGTGNPAGGGCTSLWR